MEPDRVDVWRLPLDVADDLSARLAGLLDDVEAARADRFRYPLHRRRFIARRAMMRMVLARHLGCAPREIAYDLGEHGKPELCGARSLRFNLSHSHELALLAVTDRDDDIGVDLEKHLGRRADRDSARRFFSEQEMRALDPLSGSQFTAAFFKCWTSKEAFVKALGCGLSVDLDRFAVCVAADAPAGLQWVDPTLAAADDWKLVGFVPAEGYSGALATRTRDCEPRLSTSPRLRGFDPASVTDAELAPIQL